MNEEDFEGTLVLERLARIDRVEEFMAAVDVNGTMSQGDRLDAKVSLSDIVR